MQMLEALEDMLEQQRRAISAQKVAISALKDPDFCGGRNFHILENLLGEIY